MKRRFDVSIEDELMAKVDETTANRSAFIERVLREWFNAEKIKFTCTGCEASWYSAFKPERCIACNKVME